METAIPAETSVSTYDPTFLSDKIHKTTIQSFDQHPPWKPGNTTERKLQKLRQSRDCHKMKLSPASTELFIEL
jgi:hypothetical protein